LRGNEVNVLKQTLGEQLRDGGKLNVAVRKAKVLQLTLKVEQAVETDLAQLGKRHFTD
jgi:protein-L-isoaspartate O-methyltransferase